MRWHTKPITQLVVMFVVMSVVIGAQSTAFALLTGSPQNKSVAKVEDTGLRKVAGTIPDPTCPNTDAVNYAWTENNTAIAPPRRMRYTEAPWEYDTLNTTYFSRTDSAAEFDQAANVGSKSNNMVIQPDDINKDLKISNIMSTIFRYKPTAFKNVYLLKYAAAPRGADTPHKGDAPAIEVPSKSGWPVCVPTTEYDVGGGYEAMVVAAESTRITLHIGIHEYMVGQDPTLGGCPPGELCKGGYWLYISGINVDSDILAAYNLKKGVQQGASLAQEISTRIELPIVKPGRRLGTSQGDGVTVLLRDSGPIINANKNFMWGGGFPEYDAGTPANTPPPTGAATPTTIPTAPATPPPPAAGKGSSRITVTNSTGNLNCAASLVTFWSGPTERIAVVPRESYLSGQQELAVLTDLEPGTYTVDSIYGLYANGSFTKTFARSRVVTNVVINPNQITESSINLLDAGPDYNECVAATPPVTSPTVPPGTTLTPAPTGPEVQVGDSNGYPQITVYVDNNCSAVYCNELRRFIERMESFDMTQIRILWLTLQTSQYNFANINDLRTVHEASQQYQGFTFKVLERVGNPFPSIDQITSLYLDIPLEPLFYLK